MPAQELSFLKQQAVLWPIAGYDSYGQPTHKSPTQINVRWNTVRREIQDSQNNTIVLEAEVVVIQEVGIGSLMWLGKLLDWYSIGSAGSDTELMIVKAYYKTPDLKGRVVFRTLGLMRYRSSIAQ
jgi:hypothetical protein